MSKLADGDYYASFEEIQQVLMNADLGEAGSTLFDDDAMDKALKLSQGTIHLFLNLSSLTKLSASTYPVECEVLKQIQIHQIQQNILQARHMNENNLSSIDILTTYWTLTPQITIQHRELLKFINRRVNGVSIFNYDVRTGGRI